MNIIILEKDAKIAPYITSQLSVPVTTLTDHKEILSQQSKSGDLVLVIDSDLNAQDLAQISANYNLLVLLTDNSEMGAEVGAYTLPADTDKELLTKTLKVLINNSNSSDKHLISPLPKSGSNPGIYDALEKDMLEDARERVRLIADTKTLIS